MANLLTIVTTILSLSAIPAKEALTIIPDYNELLLKVGSTQHLNCSIATQKEKLEWTHLSGDGKVETINPVSWTSIDTGTSSQVRVTNIDADNAGPYKCSLSKNGTLVVEKVIILTPVTENKTHPVFSDDMTSASLSCDISFDSNRSVPHAKWLKTDYKNNISNDDFVSKLKDQSRFKDENNTLIITNPKLDDVGLYKAKFEFPDLSIPYVCEVEFQAAPVVQDFEKAKNLIEGDEMKLQCIVKGYPYSVVSWYKNNELLNISEGGNRYTVQTFFDGHQTVRLQIDKVEFTDEGDYTCEAYSTLFNATSKKTLTVRVKDKLAALWPFLGIVGEVVFLCTIIFIYEKRRNKQVQLEEKAAEELDGSATDKKEGLRHRSTNNPTA